MQCPGCQTEMREGTAQVRGTWTGFLLVGFSLQELWFDAGQKRETVLPSREKRRAFRCPACGGVFVCGLPHPSRSIDATTGVVTEYEPGGTR